MSLKKVYAVVVSYNAVELIKRCVESLVDSDHDVQIVVVDNASTDGALEYLKAHHAVNCITLDKNVGFGRANNLGISFALNHGADYIFLLNQDATVCSDTIGKLVCEAEKQPDMGIVTPMHLNADGSGIDPNFSTYLVRDNHFFISDLYLDRDVRRTYELSFANAAAWLLSRDCLTSVGGFDPLFFMYGEDDDFCRRVRYHRYKIGFVPSAVIYHARNNYDDENSTSKKSHYKKSASMLLYLKNPKGRLRYWFIQWLIKVLSEGLQLTARRDFEGLIKHIRLVVHNIGRLPQIRQNRAKCKIRGAHWLNFDASTSRIQEPSSPPVTKIN